MKECNQNGHEMNIWNFYPCRICIFSVLYDLSFAVTLQGIFVEEHDVEQNHVNLPKEWKLAPNHYPENYKTCIDFFLFFLDLVSSFGM